jgi:cytosine/adenosine deaminase-related metal-dependent hydrolase
MTRKKSAAAPAGQSRNGGPQTCDLIVRNGYVLTMDGKRTVHPDGAIAINGNRIAAVGSTRQIEGRYRARRTIDAQGAPVHPGLIDGHYHAGLHLSRGSITDNPNPPRSEGGGGPGVFIRWINALTDEDEHASALMASVEMVKNGFTGYVEAATAFSTDAVAEAAEAVGIRVSVSDCMLWDIVGGEPMAAQIPRAPCDAKRARKLLGAELKKRSDKECLVRAHVGLYGLGSASMELTKEAKRLADSYGTVFHQHQNFMPGDAAYDRKRFGKPALVHFAETGIIGPNVIFTHMNALEDAEVEAIAKSGMGLVWHPGNFMYYAIAQQARSRFPELSRRGTPITFGTDVAKVWAFGELGFIAYLVSREWGDYVPSDALLEMFTLGGAHAMGASAELGSLEAGKRADIVIRTNALPDAQPNVDVVRQLMLVSRTKSVDTVICNGEVVVRHGSLTRLDEAAVYATAQASARRMAERAGIRLAPARAA